MDPENFLGDPLTVTQKLRAWESGLYTRQRYFRSNHFVEAWVRKLTQLHIYEGHEGCVNRLAWNESGTLLASGSDDRCINIWYYPQMHRHHLCIETGHAMNIFGIQFIPNTDDRRLVTGAMDHQVLLHQLDQPPQEITGGGNRGREGRQESGEGGVYSGQGFECGSWKFKCHSGRVKDVKVEPGNPNMFWSVSEDGTVRQYDTRVKFSSQNSSESKNVLIQLKRRSAAVELKSMDINKVRPSQVAVACGDHYVRLYDRRMLDLVQASQSPQMKAVMMLTPLHMILGYRRWGRGRDGPRSHATYVNFGNKGDKLVASYHGDHAYSFSTLTKDENIFSEYLTPGECLQREIYYNKARLKNRDWHNTSSKSQSRISNGLTTNGHTEEYCDQQLSEVSQNLKLDANREVFEHNYNQAVRHLEKALRHSPGNRSLQLFLAKTLLDREWRGDAAYALHHCDHILSQYPNHQEALMLRVRALVTLNLFTVAKQELRIYDSIYENSDAFVAEREHMLKMVVKGLREQQMSNSWKDRGTPQQQRQQEQQQQEEDQEDQQIEQEETQQQQQQLQEQVHGQQVSQNRHEDDNQLDQEMSHSEHETPRLQNPQLISGDAEIVPGDISQPVDNQSDQNMVEQSERQEMDMDVDTDQDQVQGQQQHQNDLSGWVGAVVDIDDIDEELQVPDLVDDNDDTDSIDDEIDEEMEMDRQMLRMCNLYSEDPDQPGPSHRSRETKPQVGLWCSNVLGPRHIQRYIGHCNIQTDIKEAVFLGQNDDFVAAGSDGGQIIIYDAVTGVPIKYLRADNDVANCIQCHPYEPVLATSGIESTIKLWSPQLRLNQAIARSDESELNKIVQDNQERMKEGPRYLQSINRHMLALLVEHPEYIERMMFHGGVVRRDTDDNQPAEEEEQEGEENQNQPVSCIMN